MFKRGTASLFALRLISVSMILTLVFITVACDSKATSTLAPSWYENPAEPQLPEAKSLCDAALSLPQSQGSPVAPVLTLIDMEHKEGTWTHGPEIRPIEAASAAEVQTIVCIMESALIVGRYENAGCAYKLAWDVRLVRVSDGKVLGIQRFDGGNPPEAIITGGSGGEGYGRPPTLKAFNWMLSALGDRTILYGGDRVDSVAFSPDGQLLALAGEMPILWDVSETQEQMRALAGSAETRTVIIDGEEVGVIQSSVDPADYSGGKATSVAFSPDGQLLASGIGESANAMVKLWDVATGEEIRTFGTPLRVTSVAFSPDGQFLAAASLDMTVHVWDVVTGKEVRVFSGHKSEVTSVAFSPDGQFLASGSADKMVKLWNLETGEEIRTFKGHKLAVTSVAFSLDGQFLASGSADKTVNLWNVATGRRMDTLKGHADQVTGVAFSPDGALLASGSGDNTVRLWQVSNGSLLHTLEGHIGLIQSVAFSPDGWTVASGGSDGVVRLWDVAAMQ